MQRSWDRENTICGQEPRREHLVSGGGPGEEIRLTNGENV
jgi:hypothetical protein